MAENSSGTGRIDMSEVNPHGYDVMDDVLSNLKDLCWRLTQVRHKYGKVMVVTSGLRSIEDQERINPAAMHSNHLTGRAADISDPTGDLYNWCKANESFLAETGLWMEERQGPWQHFQIVPPRSGRRWFNP